jgi:hypothetical protein
LHVYQVKKHFNGNHSKKLKRKVISSVKKGLLDLAKKHFRNKITISKKSNVWTSKKLRNEKEEEQIKNISISKLEIT